MICLMYIHIILYNNILFVPNNDFIIISMVKNEADKKRCSICLETI